MRMRKDARATFGTKSYIFLGFSSFDDLDSLMYKQMAENGWILWTQTFFFFMSLFNE